MRKKEATKEVDMRTGGRCKRRRGKTMPEKENEVSEEEEENEVDSEDTWEEEEVECNVRRVKRGGER
ncbi:hypothetical protein CesoFtcFv8_009740 [Champsocephalus esox]|uniref:Uncharacterized protein n=1 Tax=Champsocephalus esox TaxID=159716 RepID=A0AAN8C6P1_9TELE|nr:hypothetical protein CesoFtcFv8_009740 [Champsocephalus esox]